MDDPACPRCGLPPKSKSINRPSPYTAYFDAPTEQSPAIRARIRSFTLALEAELLVCDADITRLEELLHLLKNEREAGQSFIAQHKRLLSRVHALPPEILLVIFRFCSERRFSILTRPSIFTVGSEIPMPWVLSAVCRRWKSILRDSPQEWASFDVDRVSQTQTLILQDALRLSQPAALHFTLSLQAPSDARMRALVEHADRWESVHVFGSQDAFTSLGNLDHTPMLKKLWILLDSKDLGSVDLTSVLARFGTCPQLNDLSIAITKDVRVDLQTLAVSIPWANLSKLFVSFGPRSTDAIRSILVVCTNLDQLDMCGFALQSGETESLLLPQPPPFCHLRITSLTLDKPPALINHTTYPALTHICIRDADPQALLPFFSRHPHITHFELVLRCDTPPEGWDPALQLLPDILHFTLRVSPSLLRLLPLWTSLSQSISARLPNLHSLTIGAECHLLKLCDNPDIVPLVGAVRGLRRLEIYTVQASAKDWRDSVYGVPALHRVTTSDLPRVVSRMIEESTMVKALKGFQVEGLDVSINEIPLTERSAMLYM